MGWLHLLPVMLFEMSGIFAAKALSKFLKCPTPPRLVGGSNLSCGEDSFECLSSGTSRLSPLTRILLIKGFSRVDFHSGLCPQRCSCPSLEDTSIFGFQTASS